MVQSDKPIQVTISTQIEVSLAGCGLKPAQIRQLERRFQGVKGLLSTKVTGECIMLYPRSPEYVTSMNNEVTDVVQHFFQHVLKSKGIVVEWF